jgi:hypothetical protein
MGLLDMITGGFDINTFAPVILKEMKKTGAKCFLVSEKNSKIEVSTFQENLGEIIEEQKRQIDLLKIEYLKLKNELKNGK